MCFGWEFDKMCKIAFPPTSVNWISVSWTQTSTVIPHRVWCLCKTRNFFEKRETTRDPKGKVEKFNLISIKSNSAAFSFSLCRHSAEQKSLENKPCEREESNSELSIRILSWNGGSPNLRYMKNKKKLKDCNSSEI